MFPHPQVEKIRILKGKRVVPGVKQGNAIVLTRSFSAFGGIDPFTSQIIESRHPQKGEKVKGKVLIFPNGKGSSGFSLYFHILSMMGNAPRAMIINRVNSLTALAAVVCNIPTIGGPFDKGKNLIELIRTGDKILVDATNGNVYKIREM
ncbi:MAG: aconitase X swivel domain-containing protein [Candidatus Helarchaeota archaeon]